MCNNNCGMGFEPRMGCERTGDSGIPAPIVPGMLMVFARASCGEKERARPHPVDEMRCLLPDDWLIQMGQSTYSRMSTRHLAL